MDTASKKDHALQILKAATDAVHPSNVIPQYLSLHGTRLQAGEDVYPFSKFRNIYVAGAGKAAAAMAFEVEKILTHNISEGVIAVRDSFDFPLKSIRAISAGHPLPDANSVIAAEEITKLIEKVRKDDLLIFLLSGGASSLVMDVPYACTLEELNVAFNLLLKSGATIQELNVVRKHLSELKGGQLVRKCSGAIVVTLIISDVIGNDLQVIGSGPTTGDDSTFENALNVLDMYRLTGSVPHSVVSHLRNGVEGNLPLHPATGDKVFDNTRNIIIADNKKALQAAAEKASALGYTPQIVTHEMSGEAEKEANKWVNACISNHNDKVCLLAGGETTVEVTGSGKGGRNQHFALAAAIALKNNADITLLAAGTDGSDGPTDAAGAIVDQDSYHEDASYYLHNNDAYGYFEKYGGLVKTGPTHTNVMDVLITI